MFKIKIISGAKLPNIIDDYDRNILYKIMLG